MIFYAIIFKNFQSFSSCFFIRTLYFFRNTWVFFRNDCHRFDVYEVCSIGCFSFFPPSAMATVSIMLMSLFSQNQSRSPPHDVTKCLTSKKNTKVLLPKIEDVGLSYVFTRARLLHFNFSFLGLKPTTSWFNEGRIFGFLMGKNVHQKTFWTGQSLCWWPVNPGTYGTSTSIGSLRKTPPCRANVELKLHWAPHFFYADVDCSIFCDGCFVFLIIRQHFLCVNLLVLFS